MTWLLIILIMLVAFGPIAYLVPSRKDRRLASLREAARREGLNVELRQVAKLQVEAADRVNAGGKIKKATTSLAIYQRTLSKRLRKLHPFRILRGPASRPVNMAFDNWAFDPDEPEGIPGRWKDYVELLRANCENLPEGIQGIELANHSVGLFWTEPATSETSDVVDIARILSNLAQEFGALDHRLDLAESDENS